MFPGPCPWPRPRVWACRKVAGGWACVGPVPKDKNGPPSLRLTTPKKNPRGFWCVFRFAVRKGVLFPQEKKKRSNHQDMEGWAVSVKDGWACLALGLEGLESLTTVVYGEGWQAGVGYLLQSACVEVRGLNLLNQRVQSLHPWVRDRALTLSWVMGWTAAQRARPTSNQ